MNEPLIELRNLEVHFPIKRGIFFPRQVGVVRAVDGLDLQIHHGETVGLVGESGCGKSTTGRAILKLLQPTAGKVLFQGEDLATLSPKDMRFRRRNLQMIFQDPYASLNPRMTVEDIIGEPLAEYKLVPRDARPSRIMELLDLVGLSKDCLRRYPHEFSGGQRQRIGIARALALEPDFMVCDEPVSALDVSIQAQIIDLLVELRERLHLTYLFIAHDLAAVEQISDRVVVMYLGRVAEIAVADQLFARPKHPYTRALISVVPIPDPAAEAKRERIILSGEVPSPLSPPSGCYFHTRCPIATELCRDRRPEPRDIGEGHLVSCHHAEA